MSQSLNTFLKLLVKAGGSDLFLTADASPSIRLEGEYTSLQLPPFASHHVEHLIRAVLSHQQMDELSRKRALDFAYQAKGIGRFRVNVGYQRGSAFLVARHIKDSILLPEALSLPAQISTMALENNGLILVCGSTGNGKSTTLASMLELRNQTMPGHILTVEDPIEYWFEHKKCMVNQREIGSDALSYADSLKHAMRESPDVIMVGEIRDQETARHVVAFAETGHLCLSTLHATSVTQAIQRLMNLYPKAAQRTLLMDLALNLRGIVCQKLVIGTDGRRVPAVEVLMNTPYIADLIQSNRLDMLQEAMERTLDSGSCTMDQALFDLYVRGKIFEEVALRHADSRVNMSLRMRFGTRGVKGLVDRDAQFSGATGRARAAQGAGTMRLRAV